ncbi:alpha-1,2-fucosyltransferase, partial [Helicobacter pylori]
ILFNQANLHPTPPPQKMEIIKKKRKNTTANLL